MICPHCLIEIDDDSSYCDQCGKEILICTICGKIGKEKYCSNDNSVLVLNNQSKKFLEKNFFNTQRGNKKNKTLVSQSIRMINKTLNLDLIINDGDIIGRKNGRFISELANFKQISSKHCIINYTIENGWTVTEFGSTNGTKLNGKLLNPLVSYKIEKNDTLTLANIEFYIIF